jgi:predicted TIM-barrel fold metal-dependent hydrolase
MSAIYTTDDIRIVDVDSHLTEPAGLWVDHAPAAIKDRVPRIVEDANGTPRWFVDGQDFGAIGNALVAPDGEKIQGQQSMASRRYEDVHPGAYDLKARLGWLDDHGIYYQVMFPNISGFGATFFRTKIADEALRNACVTIYNDAAAEIQRDSGGRLLPLALVPWWDIDLAVKELKRVRTTLDLRGITMCDSPHNHGMPSLDQPEWDRFWSACEDLGIAVAFHIGSGGNVGFDALRWSQEGGEYQAVNTVNSFLNNSWVVSNLIFSGLLLRHPRLKIFSAESGIGWLPFLLEAMDYQWHENLLAEVRRDVWKSKTPSDLFRQNIFVSFWFEQFGPLHAMEILGEDNVMFETDFPHGTTLSERMTTQVAVTLGKFTPEVRKKVLYDNAARLYDLP